MTERAVRRTPRPLRLQLPRRRCDARGTGRAPARNSTCPPWRIMDRNGVYGAPRFHMAAKKAGVARAHRLRNHLHQRAHLSAAGRNARGLSEPLPPGHPHETARAKRAKARPPSTRLAEFARGPDLPHARIPTSGCSRSSAGTISTPNCSATTIARRRRATRRSSSARAASASRSSPPTASAYATPRAARTARRVHLRPQPRHARRRRPPAGAQLRAPRQDRPPRWRASSPISPRPSPTRARSPRASSSRWPTSATSSRATPCPEGETHDVVPAQAAPMKARAGATGPITSARASRSSANWR